MAYQRCWTEVDEGVENVAVAEMNLQGTEILPPAPHVHCNGGIEALHNIQEGSLSLSVGCLGCRMEELKAHSAPLASAAE